MAVAMVTAMVVASQAVKLQCRLLVVLER